MSVAVGIYYELPEGGIAYTYGFDGVKKTVSYRMDDDAGGRTATYAELGTWTPRRDLADFPNARDPRLPYVFDLNWDIKYISELKAAIQSRHKDVEAMRELAASNGIVLDMAPRGTSKRKKVNPVTSIDAAATRLPGADDLQSITLLRELLKQFHINEAGHLQWSYLQDTSIADVVGADIEKQMLEIRGPEDYSR